AQLQELLVHPWVLLPFYLIFPKTEPRSGPSAASTMLPGKAEKRIASSVFITLVPPRREVVTKGKTQRELQPDRAEVPGTHHPRTPPPQPPALPNGGEGCLWGAASDAGRMVMVLRMMMGCNHLQFSHLQEHKCNVPLPFPSHQAPSTCPAELRPPKFCQEQAGNLQWQDANGYPERDSSRGKGGTQLCSVGSSPVGETEARSTEPLSLPPADICAFCHKALGSREPTVEAMRKQYHADCFTCRTCHRLLAGQRYYQKDGRPTCDACYQVTLEKCTKCRGLIAEHIVRALGKGYHPGCFSCTACGRAIGAESFAVGERDEVYCVADFYRKYAVVCSACEHPIIPHEDKDTYKIECLGRSFHESCYRCESCGTPLSPEPTENGCYPLDDHLLCKSCHVRWRNESSC
uniref:Filamin binding LIM protein 1 n=1 Tax=Athene cunicularia TaxID=194338 RepID=A0A663NE56_ATHCN